MRHQNRIFGFESILDASLQISLLVSTQRFRLCRVGEVFLNKDAIFSSSHYCVSVLQCHEEYTTSNPEFGF